MNGAINFSYDTGKSIAVGRDHGWWGTRSNGPHAGRYYTGLCSRKEPQPAIATDTRRFIYFFGPMATASSTQNRHFASRVQPAMGQFAPTVRSEEFDVEGESWRLIQDVEI